MSDEEEEAPRSSHRPSLLFTKRNPPIGAHPGELAMPEDANAPQVFVLAYDKDVLIERRVETMEDVAELLGRHAVTWVDVRGIGDEAVLRSIAALFALHPLALADVVNVPQRPKTESYEHQQLVICSMLRLDPEHPGHLLTEQLSLFIGKGYVLTFQERHGDLFEPVRKRLREGVGYLRASGADLLSYAIIDVIVDGYYPVLEAFADELDELEDKVLAAPHSSVLERVHEIKRTILLVRRAVWPLRDALSTLIRDPLPLVTDSARIYLRDTYDHCAQVAEMTESYRELVSELTNTYLSVLSQRTNDVMRTLTVVTAIFIPLTFVAGVYGMNFDNMPELRTQSGYFVTLAGMTILGVGLAIYFRRRGWLGRPSAVGDDEDDAPRG